MDTDEQVVMNKINLEDLKKRCLSLEEIKELINEIKKQNTDNNTKIVIESIPLKPTLTNLTSLKTFDDKLEAIQKYINLFEYNFTNFQLSTYQKKKTFASMVDYAKILIKKSLPIRCLDAFILAAYLTSDIDKHCIRFPLRFMSKCNGKLYWHIVLGIKHNRTNKFGSIGISRKNDKLSFKKCKYKSLLDLIKEFIACYELYNHKVNMITIGVPLTINIYSEDPIFWDILQIYNKMEDNDLKKYKNILNGVFENFIKYKHVIFRYLTEEIKPYLFDKNIMFHIENQKYYLKEQYEINIKRQKEREQHKSKSIKNNDIHETIDEIDEDCKNDDVNRV